MLTAAPIHHDVAIAAVDGDAAQEGHVGRPASRVPEPRGHAEHAAQVADWLTYGPKSGQGEHVAIPGTGRSFSPCRT